MSQWYYAHDGKQLGPVPISELQRLAANGEFDPEKDLVWQEGLPDWKPAAMIPEMSPMTDSGESAAPAAAGQADNPYAAPTSSVVPSSASGLEKLPFVKAANFGLFATLYLLGTIGVLLGYGFLFATMLGVENGKDPDTGPMMIGGSILLISLVPMIIGTVMAMIYLYRAWIILQPHTQYTTPGKAVGFLFIPFYNLYWVFVAYWRWSQEWNRLVAMNPSHPQAPRANEGLFLAYAIVSVASVLFGILALIPLVIIFLMAMKTICDAVNYAASGQQNQP